MPSKAKGAVGVGAEGESEVAGAVAVEVEDDDAVEAEGLVEGAVEGAAEGAVQGEGVGAAEVVQSVDGEGADAVDIAVEVTVEGEGEGAAEGEGVERTDKVFGALVSRVKSPNELGIRVYARSPGESHVRSLPEGCHVRPPAGRGRSPGTVLRGVVARASASRASSAPSLVSW